MATVEEDQTTDSVPKEGDVLAGKYLIDRILGQGGMGVVVAAHHTTLRQKVAIKFLLRDAAKRGDATARFLREARAAVSIQSEHVARVTDVGTLEDGAPYMVMEFLTGSDLGDVLSQRGPLPVHDAVDYVLQACEAIAEAHTLGLIHRDLKPANLFLTSRADGSALVKVLDFGLSKATKTEAMDASLTVANTIMGSPYYMSPEQIRSFKTIDARADVWSLGVILYELLTATRPFDAETIGALFMVIGSDPVPPMRPRRADIPPELEAAVLKCLEKDLNARTQSVAELARSLAPFGAQNSHISVDRISRMMGDRLSVSGSAPSTSSTSSGSAAASDPSLSRPPSFSSPPPFASAPTGAARAAISTPSPEVTAAPLIPIAPSGLTGNAPAAIQGKSGSMGALAVSDAQAPMSAPAAPPAPKRTGLIVGVLALVGVVGVAAAFGLKHKASTAEAQTQTGVAPAAQATAAPTSTPSVEAHASTAEVAVAPAPSPDSTSTKATDAQTPLRGKLSTGPSASASASAAPPVASAAAEPSAAVATAAPVAEDPYSGAPDPPEPAAAAAAPSGLAAAGPAGSARPGGKAPKKGPGALPKKAPQKTK
jgi:serine/threonine-protein kinase